MNIYALMLPILTLLLQPASSIFASTVEETSLPEPKTEIVEARAGGTCKDMSSCEDAVALWCNGYRRADADRDGIPCENVCSSKEEVDRIRAEIGC